MLCKEPWAVVILSTRKFTDSSAKKHFWYSFVHFMGLEKQILSNKQSLADKQNERSGGG